MIAISLEQKIKNCLARHPEWDDIRVANSVNTRIGNVRAVREGRSLAIPDPTAIIPNPVPPAESGLISLEKVIQKYDIRSAILRELAQIPKGKLIPEAELCQRAAGTDKNRFRRTVENNEAEFRPLRILLKLDEGEKRWYWADKETTDACQRMRDL